MLLPTRIMFSHAEECLLSLACGFACAARARCSQLRAPEPRYGHRRARRRRRRRAAAGRFVERAAAQRRIAAGRRAAHGAQAAPFSRPGPWGRRDAARTRIGAVRCGPAASRRRRGGGRLDMGDTSMARRATWAPGRRIAEQSRQRAAVFAARTLSELQASRVETRRARTGAGGQARTASAA